MYTQLSNGKIVALGTFPGIDPSKVIRTLFSGQAVELSDVTSLDPADQVDLSKVASNLRQLIKLVSGQFVGRDELVEAFTTGLVAGEHTFVLGPPGTAKTAVASGLTKGIGGNLWRIVMNQDVPRDSLLGTIDPQALQGGKWTRRWSSLATCDVAVVDEVWKSSGQNANILLDALEERRVREGDCEHRMNLISALAMSNEVPEDSERQAVYDRFLIRLTVQYIKDVSSFESMLTADAGQTVISQFVTTDELRLMGAAAELLALDPPQDVTNTIKALWRELGQNGRSVSDRRWRKTLKLTMAYSLLMGEVPSARHCSVAKWTLWQDVDEEPEVRKLVMSKTDPLAGEVLNLEAMMADLLKAKDTLNANDLQAKSEITGKAGKLIDKVEKTLSLNGIGTYKDKLDGIKQQAGDLIMTVIRMV